MQTKIIRFIATFGGLGYSKIAPGTMGCLGAVIVYLLVYQSVTLYITVTAIILILGFIVSGKAEELFKRKDARQVVIDDACGFLLSMFLIPFSYQNVIIVFLLFRTIDIIKPFPIRRAEALSGGLGIMADDILAAIYANIIFRLTLHYLHL